MNIKKYKNIFCRISDDVKIAKGVKIFGFVNLYGCSVGENTKIGAFVEIQKNASVGRNVKISSHSFICEGVKIEDEVFIGHGVKFINDKYPKATVNGRIADDSDWKVVPTVVRRGASIGTNATIMCGIEIGEDAIVGAGSVVTKDVKAKTIVAGNPAKVLKNNK
jgi:acetyltransferase-like isoleucine patch superfamily enzyme